MKKAPKKTVQDLMTPHPVLISPEATLKEAAAKMEEADCGILPVGTKGHLEGVITDRDIVIRAISKGVDPAKATVGNYMTTAAYSCKETHTLQEAADLMHAYKVSRLVVKNANGNASGILSFGGILRKDANIHEITDVVSRAIGKEAA